MAEEAPILRGYENEEGSLHLIPFLSKIGDLPSSPTQEGPDLSAMRLWCVPMCLLMRAVF